MGAPRLSAKLAGKAAAHPTGTLGVDDFMTTALYDVEGGFYMRAEGVGGARQDGATHAEAAELGPRRRFEGGDRDGLG